MSVLNQSGEEQECPLCLEALEVDDLNFYPCTCGYQICRFCWNRIREMENGLCPACRKAYPENPADFTPLSQEQVAAIKTEKKAREQRRRNKTLESRKQLANVRVVQNNLVFVVGLPVRLADPEILKRQEYFGKYGKIHKVVINQSTTYAGSQQGPSASAYVTYVSQADALRAIQSVNNVTIDGRVLKGSLGTTKYCANFMKNQPCPKTDCMYLHELGDPNASFSKEEMHLGMHQVYERKLHEALANSSGTNGTNGEKHSSKSKNQPDFIPTTVVTSSNINIVNSNSNSKSSKKEREANAREQKEAWPSLGSSPASDASDPKRASPKPADTASSQDTATTDSNCPTQSNHKHKDNSKSRKEQKSKNNCQPQQSTEHSTRTHEPEHKWQNSINDGSDDEAKSKESKESSILEPSANNYDLDEIESDRHSLLDTHDLLDTDEHNLLEDDRHSLLNDGDSHSLLDRDLLNDSHTLLSDNHSLLSEPRVLLNDNRGLLNDNRGLLNDNRGLLNDNHGLLNDSHGLLNDSHGLLNDSRLLNDSHGLLNDANDAVMMQRHREMLASLVDNNNMMGQVKPMVDGFGMLDGYDRNISQGLLEQKELLLRERGRSEMLMRQNEMLVRQHNLQTKPYIINNVAVESANQLLGSNYPNTNQILTPFGVRLDGTIPNYGVLPNRLVQTQSGMPAGAGMHTQPGMPHTNGFIETQEGRYLGENMDKFFTDFHKTQQLKFLLGKSNDGLGSSSVFPEPQRLKYSHQPQIPTNMMSAHQLEMEQKQRHQELVAAQTAAATLGASLSLQQNMGLQPNMGLGQQNMGMGQHSMGMGQQNVGLGQQMGLGNMGQQNKRPAAVDDDLDFDPFKETQKAFAEILENEMQQNGICPSETAERMRRSRLPPPGFSHMNAFGAGLACPQPPRQPHQDWTQMDPAIMSTSVNLPKSMASPPSDLLQRFQHIGLQNRQQHNSLGKLQAQLQQQRPPLLNGQFQKMGWGGPSYPTETSYIPLPPGFSDLAPGSSGECIESK